MPENCNRKKNNKNREKRFYNVVENEIINSVVNSNSTFMHGKIREKEIVGICIRRERILIKIEFKQYTKSVSKLGIRALGNCK